MKNKLTSFILVIFCLVLMLPACDMLLDSSYEPKDDSTDRDGNEIMYYSITINIETDHSSAFNYDTIIRLKSNDGSTCNDAGEYASQTVILENTGEAINPYRSSVNFQNIATGSYIICGLVDENGDGISDNDGCNYDPQPVYVDGPESFTLDIDRRYDINLACIDI